jgi:hypothetical protein
MVCIIIRIAERKKFGPSIEILERTERAPVLSALKQPVAADNGAPAGCN